MSARLASALRATWLAAILAAISLPAAAVSDPREQLADPAQEARAVAIGAQLRCVVCQNESIEDSNAGIAADLRALVREHVARGESDAAVIGFVQARYGSFVRLSPPFTATTALLWVTPVLVLLLGAAAAWRGLQRQAQRRAQPAGLSDAERAELSRLLDAG